MRKFSKLVHLQAPPRAVFPFQPHKGARRSVSRDIRRKAGKIKRWINLICTNKLKLVLSVKDATRWVPRELTQCSWKQAKHSQKPLGRRHRCPELVRWQRDLRVLCILISGAFSPVYHLLFIFTSQLNVLRLLPGEMFQWLGASAALPGPAGFPAPISGGLQTPVTLAPGDLRPSSDLWGCPEGTQSHLHTNKNNQS